jgi:hypothetical protein
VRWVGEGGATSRRRLGEGDARGTRLRPAPSKERRAPGKERRGAPAAEEGADEHASWRAADAGTVRAPEGSAGEEEEAGARGRRRGTVGCGGRGGVEGAARVEKLICTGERRAGRAGGGRPTEGGGRPTGSQTHGRADLTSFFLSSSRFPAAYGLVACGLAYD